MKKIATSPTRQLPLALTPPASRLADLADEERRRVVVALSQLVLAAHGTNREVIADEPR
jgi:hypothetical protein